MISINLWCSISDVDVVLLIININLWGSISDVVIMLGSTLTIDLDYYLDQ